MSGAVRAVRPPRAAGAAAGGASRAPRLVAVDGLRGVAVLGVIVFHLDISGLLDAGFLGVDLFFTISGFLITALLLREHARTGRIDWRAFLVRRVERLVPAALAMVFTVAAVTLACHPDMAQRTLSDVPAAIAFASNWWQLVSQQSYFEALGRPPVLQHLWSLAIEEQFYLLWPLLLIALARPHPARIAFATAILLAAASAAWMALLYLEHGDAATRNRVYLGSDTHAMGLLVGAALGCLAAPLRLLEARPCASPTRRARALLGAIALVGLGWMAWTWNDATPALYTGGFLVASLLAATVILAAADPSSPVAYLLRIPLLQWAGTRSYSLYLWHWPVFVWWRFPAQDGQRSLASTIAQLALVIVAAELSYRLFEPRWSSTPPRDTVRVLGPTACALTALAAFALHADTVVVSQPVPLRRAVALAPAAPLAAPAVAAVPSPAVGAAAAEASGLPLIPATDLSTADSPLALAASAPVATAGRITVVGDSVMLGAKPFLTRELGAEVDAVVGRQFREGYQVLSSLRARDALAPVVVLHLGTNGYIVESQARQLMHSLRDRQLVVVVDVVAARRWAAPNNAVLERLVVQSTNARLVRWTSVARNHPEYFVKDGIHLTRAGMAALTRELAQAADGAWGTSLAAAGPTDGRIVRTAAAPVATSPMHVEAARRTELPDRTRKVSADSHSAYSEPPL